MLKIIIKTSLVIVLLGILLPGQVSANTATKGLIEVSHGFAWNSVLNELPVFTVKRGVPYDESKDPALRRGSENSEQPDNSFFIIPIALFVGIGLFLYYNKL